MSGKRRDQGLQLLLNTASKEPWGGGEGAWISQPHLPHLLGPPGQKYEVVHEEGEKCTEGNNFIFSVQSYCLHC